MNLELIESNYAASQRYIPTTEDSSAASKPMRIAYVVKRYPRFSETFIVNEILAHERAGVGVDIFSLKTSTDTHFQDILSKVKAPVTYLPDPIGKAVQFWDAFKEASEILPHFWQRIQCVSHEDYREVHQAIALARMLVEGGHTHVHAHFASAATTVARLAALLAGIPYSLTAHAKDIFHESVNKQFLKAKLIDAAAVVAVSNFNTEYLLGLSENRASVKRVYNGLPLGQFPFRLKPSAQTNPRVLAVGRFVEKKGFKYLVDAISLLRDQGLEVHCELLGFGELESELRAQVRALGLEMLVQFTGPQPQEKVKEALYRADAFIAPCVVGEDGNRDGLPTVLLEAMALGTPCVSTAVTGIPEVLHHEETGLLVEEHSAKSVAAAIERIVGDKGYADTLAKNARQLIEEHFDADKNAAIIRRSIFAKEERGGLCASPM